MHLDSADQLLLLLSQATRRWAETDDLDAALHDIVYTCCRVVPCHSAAIGVTSTVPSRQPVDVRAASDPDEFAVLLDIVAQVPGSPGVLAAATMSTVHCPDLALEDRPALRDFAAATVQRTMVRATMAFALQLRGRLIGVLNLYCTDPADLHQLAQERAHAIADHAAIIIGTRELEQRADNLEVALQNSRIIGAAIGILVERHRITKDAAFDILRVASQKLNRKLSVVADELVATGSIAR